MSYFWHFIGGRCVKPACKNIMKNNFMRQTVSGDRKLVIISWYTTLCPISVKHDSSQSKLFDWIQSRPKLGYSEIWSGSSWDTYDDAWSLKSFSIDPCCCWVVSETIFCWSGTPLSQQTLPFPDIISGTILVRPLAQPSSKYRISSFGSMQHITLYRLSLISHWLYCLLIWKSFGWEPKNTANET